MNLPTQASGSQHEATNVPANNYASGVLAVEAPLQPAERRRSSTISFERHDLSILAELAREIDDDEYDTEPETESEDEDDDDDDESVAERPEDDGPPQGRSNEDVLLNRLIQGGDPSRRVSELSLNLGDIREAVAELDDDEGEDEIRSFNNSVWSGLSQNYSRRSRASGSSSVSLVGRIEDDIIAKAVEKGKLVVVDDAAPRGFGVRDGYGGRSAQSSWSGESSFSSRRRVSFVRSSPIAEHHGEEQSSAPQAGADNGTSTHSRVQDNIMAALQGLRAMDSSNAPDNNDGTKSDGPKEETKSGDENKEPLSSEEGEARMEAGVLDSQNFERVLRDSEVTSPASSDLVPGAAVLSVRTMELSSPPPRGTRPRRSSLRNPLDNAH